MNWVDGTIIVILAWFIFAAFTAGFIRETVTIVAAILGVILAGMFYREVAEGVLGFVGSDRVAFTLAFLGILAGTLTAGQVIGTLMKGLTSVVQLGIADSLAGAAFGFVKGLILVELLLIFFITYPSLGIRDAIHDSAFAPLFMEKAPVLLRVLPTEFDASEQFF